MNLAVHNMRARAGVCVCGWVFVCGLRCRAHCPRPLTGRLQPRAVKRVIRVSRPRIGCGSSLFLLLFLSIVVFVIPDLDPEIRPLEAVEAITDASSRVALEFKGTAPDALRVEPEWCGSRWCAELQPDHFALADAEGLAARSAEYKNKIVPIGASARGNMKRYTNVLSPALPNRPVQYPGCWRFSSRFCGCVGSCAARTALPCGRCRSTRSRWRRQLQQNSTS